MTILFTALFFINAVLLIGVVLIQQPKTSAGLFSGTGQSLLGTSGKSFWTKFTTILAVTFMILCVLMSFIRQFDKGSSSITGLIEKQQQQQQQAASPAQAGVSSPSGQNPQPLVNPAAQGQGNVKGAASKPGDTKP